MEGSSERLLGRLADIGPMLLESENSTTVVDVLGTGYEVPTSPPEVDVLQTMRVASYLPSYRRRDL